MFHSSRIIYALLLAGAVMSGCSQREDIDDAVAKQDPNSAEETASVVFKLETNASTLSATRAVEYGDGEDVGTPEEYQVNNAVVYFFQVPSKHFAKRVELKNLKYLRTSNNIVTYESERVSVSPGTYDIFVFANTDPDPKGVFNTQNEEEFLENIDSETYYRGLIENISNGIVMTNRANDNTNVVLTNNRQTNEDNVVVVTLERVLARIDVAKDREIFEMTDNLNRKYASVTLEGYHIVNLPTKYYYYRHTAVLSSLDDKPDSWQLSKNFGNVNEVNGYVIDPYFFKKTVSATGFTNADKYYVNYFGDYSNPYSVQWTTLPTKPQYKKAYSLENCMLAPAQKNGYSTGIIFKAKVEPYNNVYHLGANGLELITDQNRYPETLYYYNYKFYDSAEALASEIGVNTNSLEFYKTKKYEKDSDGYHCYYTYWIRHEDNGRPTEMGVMEFAIVRNNLYKITVTNVEDLGPQTPPSDPDTPDEGETYLKLVINVKPWIIRNLDIVL
jgi:hypothetical protein